MDMETYENLRELVGKWQLRARWEKERNHNAWAAENVRMCVRDLEHLLEHTEPYRELTGHGPHGTP
jgi:hypothetical protein